MLKWSALPHLALRVQAEKCRVVSSGCTLGWVAAWLVLMGVGVTGSLVAQETSPDSVSSATPVELRRVRFIVSGGMAVPTGGFSTYHDLGTNAAIAASIRLMGQRVRIRPEMVYSSFRVAREQVQRLLSSDVYLTKLAAEGGDPLAERLRTRAISRLLGLFANLDLPLGPERLQPYLIGGVGAISFNSDLSSLDETLKSVTWGMNVGGGVRMKVGAIGIGVEARFRNIPMDKASTFYRDIRSIPLSFGVVF